MHYFLVDVTYLIRNVVETTAWIVGIVAVALVGLAVFN